MGKEPSAYADRWLKEARKGFKLRGFEEQWDDFLRNGKSGGRPLYWSLMLLPPHRSFQLHCHPTLEVIHIIRGALYERRMKNGPLCLEGSCGKAVEEMQAIDLSQTTQDFADGVFPEDSVNVNEMGSVHASFTKEEGCMLLCIWGGKHLTFSSAQQPKGFVCPFSCHGINEG